MSRNLTLLWLLVRTDISRCSIFSMEESSRHKGFRNPWLELTQPSWISSEQPGKVNNPLHFFFITNSLQIRTRIKIDFDFEQVWTKIWLFRLLLGSITDIHMFDLQANTFHTFLKLNVISAILTDWVISYSAWFNFKFKSVPFFLFIWNEMKSF